MGMLTSTSNENVLFRTGKSNNQKTVLFSILPLNLIVYN